jgi:dTDP-4-amino-4,6-dideoxygalactose transaminase
MYVAGCRVSSYLPSEIVVAFLWAQLQHADAITEARRERWFSYHAALKGMAAAGLLHPPAVPDDCELKGHIYYVLLRDVSERSAVLSPLRAYGIGSAFHCAAAFFAHRTALWARPRIDGDDRGCNGATDPLADLDRDRAR